MRYSEALTQGSGHGDGGEQTASISPSFRSSIPTPFGKLSPVPLCKLRGLCFLQAKGWHETSEPMGHSLLELCPLSRMRRWEKTSGGELAISQQCTDSVSPCGSYCRDPQNGMGPGSQFLQPFFHSVSFLLAFQSISFWFKVARVRSLLLTTNESTPIPVLSRGCTYSWRGRGKERWYTH